LTLSIDTPQKSATSAWRGTMNPAVAGNGIADGDGFGSLAGLVFLVGGLPGLIGLAGTGLARLAGTGLARLAVMVG
jgi:hypothetical protein